MRSRRPSRHLTVGALVALTALSVASPARAGNADTFPLGNDAALLAGAATAGAHGAAATWYNPARIALGEADDVDVSASAYLLRFGGTPALQAGEGNSATRTKLVSLDLNAVPTVIALRRRIFGLDIGAGLFVPSRTVSYPRTIVLTRPMDGSTPSEVAIDSNSRFSEYYGGLGVGRALLPNFHFGAAAFFYYASRVDTGLIGARRGESAFLIDGGTRDEQRVGGQFVLGFSWQPVPRVQIGFTVRSPVLQLISQVQQTRFLANGSESEASSSLKYDQRPLGAEPSLLVPLSAALGTAIELTPDWTTSIDVKARGVLSSELAERSQVPVANVRAGLRRRVGENVWMGGGAFTDRSGVPRATGTATVLDFYGASLGVEFGKPYRVLPQSKDAKPQTLSFATAIAFSYAIGIGAVGNIAVTPRGTAFDVVPRRDDVLAHELMLHIGSSVGNIGP